MKITAVEAIPLRATFARTFRFGTTDRTTSPNVIVIMPSPDQPGADVLIGDGVLLKHRLAPGRSPQRSSSARAAAITQN